MTVNLPADYRPSAAEEFMNPLQVEYFRRKLLQLRADAQRELDALPHQVGADDCIREGDQADQASAAVDREFDIVNRGRAHALLHQVDRALARIDNGTYGYCEDTGEPIGLRRLEAQPTATLTIEAQARRERPGT
jgi:DnaK suppressor protein